MDSTSSKRRLLLVDDDPSLQATLSDFLAFHGYDVKCVASGEEAIIAMRPYNPDLVILDMGMPGIGGTGFLDRIVKQDGSTLYPVLVLTARASMVGYFADKQIAGFVAKPADPNDLLLEIGRILFENPRTPESERDRAVLGRLLLVDGSEGLASNLAIEFSRVGFVVDYAADGAGAIARAVREPPALLAVANGLGGAMTSETLVETLRRMPITAAVPVLVYDTPDLPADPARIVAAALARVAGE